MNVTATLGRASPRPAAAYVAVVDWTWLYWLGMGLNLAGAGCTGLAVLQANRAYGTGPLEPWIARLADRSRRGWQRLRGPRRQVLYVTGRLPVHIGLHAPTVRGYESYDGAAPIEERVAWLVSRVEQLRSEAEEDRQAFQEKVAAVASQLSEHVQRSDERQGELAQALRHVGAGTARLQWRGFTLVVLGTALIAVSEGLG